MKVDPTDPSAPRHLKRHFPRWPQRALTVTLILFCLGMAGQGLTEAYSYWSDEIWSVAASRADWGGLMRDWLIPDTHPPLYQFLLKLWMGVGGSGEPATRSLSFLMAGLALVAAALGSSGRGAGRRLVTVAFLGTSPSFLFYAQETRSYATSMALSTLMLGTALLMRSQARSPALVRCAFLISCLLLSLTHYFSLMFVLVVLAVGTAEGKIFRTRTAVIPLLLTLMVWPLCHALLTTPTENLSRINWIQVTPISGTITQFIAGTLPLLDPRPGLRWVPILIVLVGGIVAATHPLLRPVLPRLRTPALGEARFLLLVIVSFVALMLAVDLIKPMSQSRYYIVVLPAVAYLAGIGWELTAPLGRLRRAFLACLLTAVLLLQLRIGHQQLAMKHRPLENYKLLGSFVAQNDLCSQDKGCWSSGWFPAALTNTYFGSSQLMVFDPNDVRAQEPLDRPLLGFRKAYRKLKAVIANNPGMACWEPPGAWEESPFILLPRTNSSEPERHGLRPCP